MTKRLFLFLLLTSLISLLGCFTNPSDVGRVQENSFENERRKQEELIKRQQEVIERQQRELTDIKRQSVYDEQLRRLDPKE
jgi:hypothetical protein